MTREGLSPELPSHHQLNRPSHAGSNPCLTASFGMCPEPKAVWMVQMTPTGVTDLGHRFLQPELKWADELLSTVAKQEDAASIGRPDVVTTIKSAMEASRLSCRRLAPRLMLAAGSPGACSTAFAETVRVRLNCRSMKRGSSSATC